MVRVRLRYDWFWTTAWHNGIPIFQNYELEKAELILKSGDI